ncbi:hypothetical protein BV25DRAFT_1841529 [Artomyces pyxidatus]|uniref:Uncharacterized protein n=1 Tax=Artomyces pyxidatus TaxID=48021 RepID=A0ACB8SN92_9AGAM|nr:hypothetical protein BV25DRAFT_1841529 [Artomyces pyxidatus]
MTSPYPDFPHIPRGSRLYNEETMNRRREAFNEYFKTVIEQRKPVAELPRKYVVTRDNPHPPFLAFGFLRTIDQLFAYAQKHGLKDDEDPDEPLTPEFCVFPCLERLREVASEPYLSIVPVFSPTDEEVYVVTLYTNNTMCALQCTDEDEQDILQLLREELEIADPPMWYWDVRNQY